MHEVVLHARSAVLRVRKAHPFRADPRILSGGRRTYPHPIMSLLPLDGHRGVSFMPWADGPDTNEPLNAICKHVARDLTQRDDACHDRLV
jgi:phosphotransferase system HPr-like phosphotransfer protein